MSINDTRYRNITQQFMNLHKIFFIFIFIESIYFTINFYMSEAKLNFGLLTLSVFWLILTFLSAYSKKSGFFEVYDDKIRNSSHMFRIIIFDMCILSIAILVTHGKFNIYPYVIAGVITYSLVILGDIRIYIIYFLVIFNALIKVLDNKHKILPQILGKKALDIDNSMNVILSSTNYHFVDILSQAILLFFLLFTVYKLRSEILSVPSEG